MPPRAPRHPVAVQGPTDPASLYAWVTWDRSDPAVTKYEVLRDGVVIGTVGPFVPFDQTNAAHRNWRTAGYASAVLADSPAYYFRLEQTGSSMTDSGPNGLIGATEKPFGTAAVLPNTTGPITGQTANNAKTFNGTDERFVVGNNAVLDIFTGAWSIELWVKRSATQAATQNLWLKGTNQPLLKFHTDNKVRVRKNGVGDVTESTIAITDQLWHHIVAVKPATGDPLIYIDGVDRTGTQLAAGTTYVNTTSIVSHAGGSAPFPGSLDEPAVYGTALSAARVKAHYDAAAASPTRPFDDTWDKCAFKDTTVTAGQAYRYAVRAFVGTDSAQSTSAAGLTVEGDGAYGLVRQVAAPSGGDDTSVLQAAINTAQNEGGVAVLQSGTYKFSQLSMNGSRMVMRGQGKDVTFLRPTGPGGAGTGTAAQDQFVVNGSRVTLTATLSQAIAVGSTTATLSATNELSVGSVLIFAAPNVGGTASAAYQRGDVITPGVEYDEINRWECNEVTAISGTSVTFRYPFSQPIPSSASIQRVGEAVVGTRRRGLVFERFTIEGVSATDSTYFTHFDVDGVVGTRWADVRARFANGNVAAITNSYGSTFVDCDEPHHGTAPAQTIQYSVSFARVGNGRVIACSFGTDGTELVKSPVTTQRAPRTLVRHSVFHWPGNYACNEHGGGSRDWVFENNWFNLGTNTEYAGVFLGNPDFANAGRGIVRNNRQDRGPILVYGREHSYGVRVLDNIAYDLASNALSLAAALVVWGGWDAPAEDSVNWGAARLSVKRNAVFGSTSRGLLLGRRSSTYFGDGTTGNPDPAGDGGGYLGVKDAIVENNHLDVSGTAIELLGTSTTTNRFQVRNNTGRVSFVKPTFVTGDHWENNGDGELFGSPTAVGWADEFFAWETTPAAAPPSVSGAASVVGEGRVVASGSVAVGSATRTPTTNTVVVTGWTNPNNAHADDTSYATAAPGKGATISTDWRGFGFDSLIPAGAEITSVTVSLTWVASDGRGGPMGSQVYVAGVAQGTEFTKDPSTVEATDSYTVPGLTRTSLLDANFAVRARASRPNTTGSAYTASLDVISVTVAYSMPVYRSVAVSGAGVVVVVGRRVTAGAGVLVTGTGQITVAVRKRAIGTALVSAPGVALARGGRPTTLGVAHVLGEGVVTVTNRKEGLGQITVVGEGVLSARGRVSIAGDALVTAGGVVRTSGSKRSSGVVLVTGEGVVTISAPQPTFPDAPIAPPVVRPNLIPTGPESPLSPVSGTEIRVSLGVVHPEGDVELTEVGVFGLESTDSAEAGGGVKLSIQGMDRSIKIQRDRFREPYIVQLGTNYVAAIMALVRRSLPTAVFRAEPTQHTTPLLQWEFGDDPLEAIADMAESIGYEAFFGGDGAFVLRSAAVVVDDPVWDFVEGPETVVDSLGRGLTREGVYNGVVQRGENRTTDVPPVQAEAWDTDPTSPTYYDPAFPERSSFGAVPLFHVSPFLVTVEQARDAAVARVRTLKGLSEQVTITSRQVPGLEGGDVVRATRARLNLAAVYVIERISLPLRAGMMSIRARERRL